MKDNILYRFVCGNEKLKKYLKYILLSIPVFLLLVYILLELSCRSAALIFNHAMEEQDMLRGTITVDRLSADIAGNVSFQELVWTTPEGKPIIKIPSGSFQVDLLDVLIRHFNSRSIRSLKLQNASISLYLDENMKMDIIHNTHGMQQMEKIPDISEKLPFSALNAEERKRLGEEKRAKFQQELVNRIHNFHLEGKDIRLRLELEQCRVEVIHKNHHYLISSVNIDSDIDTKKNIAFRIWTGPFGGTMIGRGMTLNGNIRMEGPAPECDFSVLLKDVDPSSLGFGIDVHDNMTLSANFSESIAAPVGSGTIEMEELHIPGLDFANVNGDVHYHDSKLEFRNVTAKVYGGTLKAEGVYDFDTRYYQIDGVGEDLQTKKALPGAKLSCKVHLDISMESKGSAKETYIHGSFRSGPGFYHRWISFDEISGRFSNTYKNLSFYDVKIQIGDYQVTTDALSIIDKKLTLNPIYLMDENGKPILTYDPETKSTNSEDKH